MNDKSEEVSVVFGKICLYFQPISMYWQTAYLLLEQVHSVLGNHKLLVGRYHAYRNL